MTHNAENDALDKSLGRRALDCGCCSAVDDVGLDDLIAEVIELRLNDVARAICDSEAFMWLMVGANHPEAHLSVLRQAWRDHYLPNGGGYGARTRPLPPGGGMPDAASLTPEESARWAEALDGRPRVLPPASPKEKS